VQLTQLVKPMWRAIYSGLWLLLAQFECRSFPLQNWGVPRYLLMSYRASLFIKLWVVANCCAVLEILVAVVMG
jgi:hypothetical protein